MTQSEEKPRRLWKRRVALWLLIGVGVWIFGSWAREQWQVRTALRAVKDAIEHEDAPIPEEWGALVSLEARGHDTVNVFWDIGGVSGNIVIGAIAQFRHRKVPVVIELNHSGKTTQGATTEIGGMAVGVWKPDRIAGYVRRCIEFDPREYPEVVRVFRKF